MCARHWRKVPRTIQRAVWTHYRPGQCDDKCVTLQWLEAADAAIGFVSVGEHRTCSKGEAKALVKFGYEQILIDMWSTKKHRDAARVVVDGLKKELGL